MQKNQINVEDYYNSENILYELIDVRSPSEYLIDHIPDAINYPALNDLERTNIGKLYNENSFEAKKMGAALICKNIANYLENDWKINPDRGNLLFIVGVEVTEVDLSVMFLKKLDGKF